MVYIVVPSVSYVSYVAANLRPDDVKECEATYGKDANIPERLLAITAASGNYAWVATDNSFQPLFVYGVLRSPMLPHFGMAWGFGTRRARRAIPAISEHLEEIVVPKLLSDGVHRVEVRVLQGIHSSVTWLTEYMGAEFEAVLEDQGANREPFLQFAWTRSSFQGSI